MKKILIIANSDAFIANFKIELLEKLVEKQYFVYVVCPEGDYIDLIIKTGAIHINSKIERRGTNPIKDYVLYSNYKRVIRNLKPDIVLTMTIKPNIYGGIAAQKYNIPYISNISGLGTAFKRGYIFRRIVTALYKKAFKKVNYVFFENQANLNLFVKDIVDKDKTVVIPGSGVNLKKYKILNYPPNDTISFLYLGRIMREKGIDEFIEAAKIIKKKYPTIDFNVVGPFEEIHYRDIINKLNNSDIINYFDQTNDVLRYIEDSNALVQPSFHEGLSNVLLEAAASARPVIATNIPGCREAFDENITGFGFEPGNVLSLVNSIEKFIELSYEERVKMGLNGRKKIEREFDRERVNTYYINKIIEVIGSNEL